MKIEITNIPVFQSLLNSMAKRDVRYHLNSILMPVKL